MQKPLNPEENKNEELIKTPRFPTRVANFTCESQPVTRLPQLCTLSRRKRHSGVTRGTGQKVSLTWLPLSLDSPPVRRSWDIMELRMLLRPALPDTRMPRVCANFPTAG